jgi:hypothetical protein
MPAIWPICGFSVSIHSRSAPFCSEVMQSSTQRSSPVPARNWNRLEGRRLGRSSLPSRVMMTSPWPIGRVDFFAIEEAVILVARCRPVPDEGDLLGEAGAERVGAGDDDAIIDAQFEEGVAAGADLREEVLMRHGDLAVLVAALLFVRNLVFDLEGAGARLDHLLGEQIGRLGIAETGVDVGDDRNDVGFVIVDRVLDLLGLDRVAGFARGVEIAEQHAQFAGVGLRRKV